MVQISHETPQQTHARLRAVLAEATLERLPGSWSFAESLRGAGATLHPKAIAAVRDRDVLSQLVPAEQGFGERFCVFSFHFLSAQDNSGFVGWLASELKRALGTGVFVICGANSGHGGIYDYWGVPEQLGDRALSTIAELARADQLTLDGRLMRATASEGEIDARTVFHFSQRGSVVSAHYAGGAVQTGELIGLVAGRELLFRYVQVGADERLDSGVSRCQIEVRGDGGVRLVERFEWTSHAGSGVNVIEEAPRSSRPC